MQLDHALPTDTLRVSCTLLTVSLNQIMLTETGAYSSYHTLSNFFLWQLLGLCSYSLLQDHRTISALDRYDSWRMYYGSLTYYAVWPWRLCRAHCRLRQYYVLSSSLANPPHNCFAEHICLGDQFKLAGVPLIETRPTKECAGPRPPIVPSSGCLAPLA